MSLLMKALEKAAKDRVTARSTEPATAASAAAPAGGELSLEPLGAESPAAAPRPVPAPRAAAPARPAAAPAAPASREQEQASTVLQAARRPSPPGVVARMRAHPLWVMGGVAGLFAIGYGVYVYLQIFQPGILARPLAPAPKGPLPPIAAAPTQAGAPGLLPAAPLLKESAAESAPEPAARPPRDKPQAAAPAPAAETPANTIVVSSGTPEPALNPLLTDAYAALQANRLDAAHHAYEQLLKAEPKNTDALLGLAAIATMNGNSEDAIKRYLRILELDPRHALAQAGLIALLGRADPLAAESRLRQLIAREPSAHLYFTLGNLYAEQSLWAPAQQAWFQAHHLDPANPDYAYNLAVGLEHVSQPKLALDFYRRAVQLATARGRANFNPAHAKERISKLAARVE